MGEDKALVLWQGKPLIHHVAETLRRSFQKVLIVSDRGTGYEFLDLPVVRDVYRNCGPIAGIHSALIHAWFRPCFVVATDLPRLNDGLIAYLLQEWKKAPAIVPSFQGRLQPLCGIYTHLLLPQLEMHLKESRLNLHQFLADVGARVVAVDRLPSCRRDTFLNVNTREDYERLGSVSVDGQASTGPGIMSTPRS